jgi:hypothetical protein
MIRPSTGSAKMQPKDGISGAPVPAGERGPGQIATAIRQATQAV